MGGYRNVFALILAVGIAQLAGGLLGVVAPLGLEAMAVNAFEIGLIAAAFSAGYMVGAWTAPAAIAQVGTIRIFSAGGAASAAGALLMHLAPDPFAWTFIRLIQGVGLAWLFTSAESWLAQATPAENRGGVSGAYHLASKGALMAGPFFAVGATALDASPYLWCGVFLALSLLPVCLTRQAEPGRPEATPFSLVRLTKIAPSAVAGVFLAGVMNTGTLSLLPVFTSRVSGEIAAGAGPAAIALAVAWLGGLLSQWPAGRVSDRIDRRLVVAVMALISGASAATVAVTVLSGATEAPLLFIALWGAGALSFYSICVAHAVDRATTAQIPRVMSGLIFVWALGSVVGPPLSGLAMRTALGPSGLFFLDAALSVLLALAMSSRLTVREVVDDDQREDWSFVQPTTVAGTEIDPRGDAPDDELASA